MKVSFRAFASRRGSRVGLTCGLLVAVVLGTALAGCGNEEQVTVPDLVGMKTDAAQQALEAAGLKLGDIERLDADTTTAEDDTVVSQLPVAGSEVEAGSEIALVATPEEVSADDSASPSATPAATGDDSSSGDDTATETPAAESESESTTEPEPAHSWHTVATFSGAGGDGFATSSFVTTASRLQLTVVVTSPSNGWFGFRVGTTAMPGPVFAVQGSAEKTKKTFELTRKRGKYGLRVQSPTDGEWSARVREWR